jgi:cytochrome b561
MRSDKVSSYSSMMKSLHWIIALIVITMLSFSFFLGDLPKAYRGTGYMIHKSTGLVVLTLMLWRLCVVYSTKKPKLPVTVSAWERLLLVFVQVCFYILLIIMPLTGWITSMAAKRIPSFYGLFNLPLPGIPESKSLSKLMAQSHKIIAWVLIALLVLHVLGALKHHIIDKDGVLRAMLPSKK